MKYTIELSGPTIAVYASLGLNPEIRDACRACLTEHDLDADGNEKPLTVNGHAVHFDSSLVLCWRDDEPVSYDYVVRYATPDERSRIDSRLRKALGVELPEPKRTCDTCRYFPPNHCCTHPTNERCVRYCKWEAKP